MRGNKRNVVGLLVVCFFLSMITPRVQINAANQNSSSYRANSYSEFVSGIRKALVKRETSLQYIYSGDMQGLQEIELFRKALTEAYTNEKDGKADEGDYMYYSFAGFTCSSMSYSDYIIFNIGFAYRSTYDEELQVTQKINDIISKWDVDSMNEIEKIKQVHDYVVQNVTYDYSYMNYSAYHALIEGTAVCQGYALLTYRMLKEIGIDTRIISGKSNGGNHAWNIVRVGEGYYNMDTTWDATASTQEGITYEYFCQSDEDFNDHDRDEEFLTEEFQQQYPMHNISYFFPERNLELQAPVYQVNSIYGENYANQTGTYTVIIFGNTNDRNFIDTVASIESKLGSDQETVRIIPVDLADYSSVAFLFARAASLVQNDGSVSIPIVALIDQKDILQFVFCGLGTTGGRIKNAINVLEGNEDIWKEEVENYIPPITEISSVPVSPSPTQKPIGISSNRSLVKGSTHKIGNITYQIQKMSGGDYTVECQALLDRNKTKIVIPATIKIEDVTFQVVSIAKNAFKGNKRLKEVTIGTNITTIKKGAFQKCSKLKKIRIKSSKLNKISKKAFTGVNKKAKVTYPSKIKKLILRVFVKD